MEQSCILQYLSIPTRFWRPSSSLLETLNCLFFSKQGDGHVITRVPSDDDYAKTWFRCGILVKALNAETVQTVKAILLSEPKLYFAELVFNTEPETCWSLQVLDSIPVIYTLMLETEPLTTQVFCDEVSRRKATTILAGDVSMSDQELHMLANVVVQQRTKNSWEDSNSLMFWVLSLTTTTNSRIQLSSPICFTIGTNLWKDISVFGTYLPKRLTL